MPLLETLGMTQTDAAARTNKCLRCMYYDAAKIGCMTGKDRSAPRCQGFYPAR